MITRPLLLVLALLCLQNVTDQDDYFIATLDFPGFGFSDKPLDGFNYMLEENAQIVDYFDREVVHFT